MFKKSWITALMIGVLGCGRTATPPSSIGIRYHPRWREIAVGSEFSCTIRSRQVYCWGNLMFDVGGGRVGDVLSPRLVVGLPQMQQLSARQGHACGVDMDGGVWCWGRNANGELGAGDANDHRQPVHINGLHGIIQVSAGGFYSCALDRSHKVYCWGGYSPVRSDDENNRARLLPERISGVEGVEVATGDIINCVRQVDARIVCWRQGLTSEGFQSPLGIGAASSLRANGNVCAETSGGIACWGDVHNISIGRAGPQWPVSLLQELGGGRLLDTTLFDTCALSNSTRILCRSHWNSFMSATVGVPRTDQDSGANRWRISSRSFVSEVLDMSMSTDHVCAQLADHSIYCFGQNDHGQLGDGTTSDRNQPVLVRF